MLGRETSTYDYLGPQRAFESWGISDLVQRRPIRLVRRDFASLRGKDLLGGPPLVDGYVPSASEAIQAWPSCSAALRNAFIAETIENLS